MLMLSFPAVSALGYTPALLLDARLDASLTDHARFAEGCEFGFLLTQRVIEEDIQAGTVLPNRALVIEFVENNLFVDKQSVLHEGKPRRVGALAFSAGVVLGGLSALALLRLEEVEEGLELLRRIVCA